MNELINTQAAATMFTIGAFGIVATEVRDFMAGERPYAQYDAALQYQYIAKGKRKAQAFVKTYKPWVVLVEGHNLPKTLDAFEKVDTIEGMTAKRTRFACFDENYAVEANEFIEKLKQAGYNVMFDYRKD